MEGIQGLREAARCVMGRSAGLVICFPVVRKSREWRMPKELVDPPRPSQTDKSSPQGQKIPAADHRPLRRETHQPIVQSDKATEPELRVFQRSMCTCEGKESTDGEGLSECFEGEEEEE